MRAISALWLRMMVPAVRFNCAFVAFSWAISDISTAIP
jgi:hypothetical protein